MADEVCPKDCLTGRVMPTVAFLVSYCFNQISLQMTGFKYETKSIHAQFRTRSISCVVSADSQTRYQRTTMDAIFLWYENFNYYKQYPRLLDDLRPYLTDLRWSFYKRSNITSLTAATAIVTKVDVGPGNIWRPRWFTVDGYGHSRTRSAFIYDVILDCTSTVTHYIITRRCET